MKLYGGLCLLQDFSPNKLLVLLQPRGSQPHRPLPWVQGHSAEQGPATRSSDLKESFILFPLCPAAPLEVNNNKLLLLPPSPGCPPFLLLWLTVPPFGSPPWFSIRGGASLPEMTWVPLRGGKSMWRAHIWGLLSP